MSTEVSKCRDCGAPIYWLHAVDNFSKRMPVNAVPEVGQGNVEVHLDSSTYRVLPKAQAMVWSFVLYTSHFATCPNAAARRKK